MGNSFSTNNYQVNTEKIFQYKEELREIKKEVDNIRSYDSLTNEEDEIFLNDCDQKMKEIELLLEEFEKR